MSLFNCRLMQSLVSACLVICLFALPLHAATMTILNMDGPNEGLNDRTPATPVAGNTGTTLGQQRLLAAQFAASIWNKLLVSDIEIRIELKFDPLGGNEMSATLAVAGPTAFNRDFPGAPRANTFYVPALANALANRDLDPMSNDITSTVNSDVDGDIALGTTRFYYGFDRNGGPNTTDFVSTFLHELAHGLGFLSALDTATGAKAMGIDDAYSLHLIHRGATPEDFPSMTNAQRLAAFTAGPNLRWNCPNVKNASRRLTFGASMEGDVEIFAPNPFSEGSSVSHFSTSLSPEELMEPNATVPIHDVGLTLELFQDLGWRTQTPMGQACDMVSSGDMSQGQAPCEEDLPNNNTTTARSGLIGDLYTFTANAGTQIDLRVNTTDANLDPMLFLISPSGSLIASGDNEVPCAVPLACGLACPQIAMTLQTSGTYSVVVLDSINTTCRGGQYEVTADQTGGIRLIADDGNTGVRPMGVSATGRRVQFQLPVK